MEWVWLSCQLATCITNTTYALATEWWFWYQPATSPFNTKHTYICVCLCFSCRSHWCISLSFLTCDTAQDSYWQNYMTSAHLTPSYCRYHQYHHHLHHFTVTAVFWHHHSWYFSLKARFPLPELTGDSKRQLGPSTRVVETGLKDSAQYSFVVSSV